MNKINCKLLENSTLVKPNNEWKEGIKILGFMRLDSDTDRLYDVERLIFFVENLLHQQKKDLIEEIETAVQWAIDNSKGDSYHNGLEEAKHILHLLKEKV